MQLRSIYFQTARSSVRVIPYWFSSSTLLTGDGGKIITKGHSSETAYLHQKTISGVGERGGGGWERGGTWPTAKNVSTLARFLTIICPIFKYNMPDLKIIVPPRLVRLRTQPPGKCRNLGQLAVNWKVLLFMYTCWHLCTPPPVQCWL